jgi:hypothetical protein
VEERGGMPGCAGIVTFTPTGAEGGVRIGSTRLPENTCLGQQEPERGKVLGNSDSEKIVIFLLKLRYKSFFLFPVFFYFGACSGECQHCSVMVVSPPGDQRVKERSEDSLQQDFSEPFAC